MALLALIVAGSAFLLVQKLNAASTQVDREAQTRKALLQAKQALLAFAALDDTPGSNMNRPGSLPCPAEAFATTARKDWGTALASCGSTANRVGRLPWKTLGLPELTDGSGEYLWYALSPRFRDLGEINANLRGQIDLCRVGSAPCPSGESVAGEVVAVIFAPGAPVTTSGGYLQDRSTNTARDLLVNYLEDYVLDTNASLGAVADQFRAGPVSGQFNDRLIAITQADLLEATENTVAARLRTLILPRLRRYFADWGAFPYAAPFNPTDTILDAKLGPATQGMLPLALGPTATMSLGWKSLLYEVKQGALTVGSCTAASAADELVCDMPAPVSGSVTLSVEIADVGFGLVEPMQQGVASPAAAVSTQAFAASLQANGTANVVATFTVNSPTIDVQVRFALPQKSTLTGFTYDWLVLNRWYQQVLYAIPPNMAPGGSATCATTATANCLTIQRRDGAAAAASVALVLAGRPVLRESPPAGCAVQIRPPWPPLWAQPWDQNPAPGCLEPLTAATYLQNYFEGVNNDAVTTLPVTFKEGYRSPTFNDRVVWLTAYDAGATPRMECAPWKCQ